MLVATLERSFLDATLEEIDRIYKYISDRESGASQSCLACKVIVGRHARGCGEQFHHLEPLTPTMFKEFYKEFAENPDNSFDFTRAWEAINK